MSNIVENFYDSSAQEEWDRLDRHRMEFRTTLRAMREFIPPCSTILDIGGGPGRYSIELAKAGHKVTLLDLSAQNVELARQKAKEMGVKLVDYVHGNALHLSRFADGMFDVVLLMGPLYHLVEPADRDRAIREALRVLRPGGLIFASFITRYAIYVDLLKFDPSEIGGKAEAYAKLAETGVYIPGDETPGFTEAYFIHPMEVEPLMSGYGLSTLRLAVAEGIIASVEYTVNALPENLFEAWVDVCYKLGTDPVTWGAGEHMLYVGTSTGQRPGPAA